MRLIFIFAAFLVLYGAAAAVWWSLGNEKRRQQLVRNLTSTVNAEGKVHTSVLIEQPTRSSGLSGMFGKRSTPGVHSAPRVDPDKTARLSKGRFFLLTVAAAAAGFFVGTKFTDLLGIFAPLIFAFVGGVIPKMYRSRASDKRMGLIEEQFPEALDFLARSVRAGNAFSIALELLAGEAPEPLKTEFVKLTREMALGASLEDALHGLIARVQLLEVRMFVAAVLLQRETGGNLSEVLMKLGTSVRERLRLRGQVKAASGQSQLTAKVLTFLPIATLVLLKVGSPAYIDNLIGDPMGRNLLGLAVVSQILGYIVMQKMIRFEV